MALFLQLAAFALLVVRHDVLGDYLYQELMPGTAEWGYHGTNGPEFWCNLNPPYEECCNTNKRQSPVNIDVETTKYPAYRLTYKDYDVTPGTMNLFNNGHTVVLTTGDTRKPSISFKLHRKRKVFALNDVHFHWGKVSSRGSEHTINKGRSPMEMHIVHSEISFKSLLAATKVKESLAVIGVFFEICQNDNPRLNGLINSLISVKYGNSNASIPPFKFSDLLPSSQDYFFSYDGSLTTPPCSETVRWIVLNTKVPISEAQLNKFRQLQEKPLAQNPKNAFPLVDNFRPLQNLHNRPIYRSKRN